MQHYISLNNEKDVLYECNQVSSKPCSFLVPVSLFAMWGGSGKYRSLSLLLRSMLGAVNLKFVQVERSDFLFFNVS